MCLSYTESLTENPIKTIALNIPHWRFLPVSVEFRSPPQTANKPEIIKYLTLINHANEKKQRAVSKNKIKSLSMNNFR